MLSFAPFFWYYLVRECNKRFTHRSTLRNHRKLIHFEQNGSITIVFEEEADIAAAAAAVAANQVCPRSCVVFT